jgi:ABC-type branched-subunit amino acid transport system substrate-binding protein
MRIWKSSERKGGATVRKISRKLLSSVFVVALFTVNLSLAAGGSSPVLAKDLKIGALVNLKSQEGIEMQRWLNLFAKIYNERGGWQIGGEKYQVKPMVYDCGNNDVSKTRSAAERAVLQDGVKFIVATWGDVPEESVTVTEPNKAMWMGVSFRDEMADTNLKYAVKGQGLFFGYGMGFTIQKDTKAKGARTDLIVNPDTQMGKVGTGQWSGSAKVAGLQVVEPLYFNMSTTDFGPLATKIKAANPDFVESPFVTGDQITNIVAALKDAGYKGRIYPGSINPLILDNIVKKVGKEYVEGWECVYHDPRGIVKDPEIVALMGRYVKEYKEWRTEGCFWMSPWFFFKDAIENTQSVDVDTVVKYLRNSKKGVKTFEGYAQLFARPDLKNYKTIDSAPGCYLAVIKDGKFVPLKTVAVKDQYLVSIKAMGLVDVYEKYWQEYGRPTFPPQQSLYDFSDLKM